MATEKPMNKDCLNPKSDLAAESLLITSRQLMVGG
jgi:hypothetical protein